MWIFNLQLFFLKLILEEVFYLPVFLLVYLFCEMDVVFFSPKGWKLLVQRLLSIDALVLHPSVLPKYTKFRSSRPDVFCRKGVLRNFGKFTGKHLCQSLFIESLLKNRLWHWCFPLNFAKFLKTLFAEDLRWLLLKELNETKNYTLPE